MSRHFLLARRPGWRGSALLSTGVVLDGGLQLAALPAPSVFDEPPALAVNLPCCRRAVLDAAGRRVLLSAGTGQVLRVIGPVRVHSATADGPVEPEPVEPSLQVPDVGCDPVPVWPDGTWQPFGLVALGPDIAVLDRDHRIHRFDGNGHYLGRLNDLPAARTSAEGARFGAEGRLTTVGLDSGLPGCGWHRVVLSGSVPSGTQVEVRTLTTDLDLTEAEVAGLDDRWRTAAIVGELAGTGWDALVAGPPGQYLWLRLVLRGDGQLSPRIDDVEVHFPRVTSRDRLPAVFATGESDFLERFLALTDTVRASVTELLDHLPWELDARSADADDRRDFLAWLGSWIGMDDIDRLPVPRQRRLIRAAAELYRRRGTPDGVARHTGLWLGRRTVVLEHYQLRRWAVHNASRLGDASELFGPEVVRRLKVGDYSTIGEFALVGVPSPRTDPFRVFAHAFTLFVHAGRDDDTAALAASARRIVAAVSPAHTSPVVCVVRPTARLGVQSRLGMDAVVAGPQPAGHLGDQLGIALAADPRAGGLTSIGIDARVGTRAVIG
jgi:phage tail-like protein